MPLNKRHKSARCDTNTMDYTRMVVNVRAVNTLNSMVELGIKTKGNLYNARSSNVCSECVHPIV